MVARLGTGLGRMVRQFRALGPRQYIRYLSARNGSEIALTVHGTPVWLRKGTPDLQVAVSCLGGEFEPLRHLLPKNYDGVIVDAGGYIGTATLALRAMFPHARLIVIEPSEGNLAVLRRNLDRVPGVEVVHGALVGTAGGTISLKSRGTGEWGLTAVEDPQDAGSAETLHQVRGVTLGDLVGEAEDIGLLKLDIEGGEVALIKEDAEALGRVEFIFAELHERIVEGCERLFFEFSRNRHLIKGGGEKYLSIRR